MSDLRAFKAGLEACLSADPSARPFVCTGSPLECRSFIVGFNAATRLRNPFSSYWSDSTGFDRQKFDADYREMRPRTSRGNRPRIEALAKEIGPCLETNLYAIPSRRAGQLTKDNRRNPIICYLFRAIRPELVFVHSNEPIRFFEEKTGCSGFTFEVKRARWQGHDFWLFGRPGPLYTLRIEDAAACGAKLAKHLDG
jgi:hypothetical protein